MKKQALLRFVPSWYQKSSRLQMAVNYSRFFKVNKACFLHALVLSEQNENTFDLSAVTMDQFGSVLTCGSFFFLS